MKRIYLISYLLTVCVSGCLLIKPPHLTIHYYTLTDSIDTGAVEKVYDNSYSNFLVIAIPQLPQYLLKPTIAIRNTDLDPKIKYSDIHRWAEPLQIGIQRTLQAYLQKALPSSIVLLQPCIFPVDSGIEICLMIDQFEVSPHGQARAKGRWSINNYPTRRLVHICNFDIVEQFNYNPDDFTDAVQALSTTIKNVSYQIAQYLNNLR